MNVLAITTPAGLALMGLAILTMKKRAGWHKTIAIMMLLAGIGLSGIIGICFAWVFDMLGRLFGWIGHGIGHVPVLPTVIAAFPTGMRWMVGLILLSWFAYDMWPRKWRGSASRGGRGGTGGGGVPGGGGGVASHGASRHTAWVGLFVASAWLLMPPLSTLVGIR